MLTYSPMGETGKELWYSLMGDLIAPLIRKNDYPYLGYIESLGLLLTEQGELGLVPSIRDTGMSYPPMGEIYPLGVLFIWPVVLRSHLRKTYVWLTGVPHPKSPYERGLFSMEFSLHFLLSREGGGSCFDSGAEGRGEGSVGVGANGWPGVSKWKTWPPESGGRVRV